MQMPEGTWLERFLAQAQADREGERSTSIDSEATAIAAKGNN